MNKHHTLTLVAIGLLTPLAMSSSLKAKDAKSTESPQNAVLVQAAYTDLTTADHDYKGHRAAAAKSLKHFAKHHGITLPEGVNGKFKKNKGGKEQHPQAASDAKLRDAEAKLQQVIDSDASSAKPVKRKVKNGGSHIAAAIKDIQEALAVK